MQASRSALPISALISQLGVERMIIDGAVRYGAMRCGVMRRGRPPSRPNMLSNNEYEEAQPWCLVRCCAGIKSTCDVHADA